MNVQIGNGARSSNQGEHDSLETRRSKKDKAREKAASTAKTTAPEKPREKPRKGPKGGKGEGKGGGGPKGVKNKLAVKHEGKQICFAFNNGKCTGNYTREHVCQICFGKHAKNDCSSKE